MTLSRTVGDDELAQRIAEGDRASLGVLFDRYHADVRRFLGRLGVSAADVDDMVQETFVRVMSAAQRYDGRASARVWLFGIAAMLVRERRRSIARILRGLLAFSHEEMPPVPTPADALHRDERSARATRALERLSAKKREVLILVVVEGARGEDVAAALGIPVATVWTRLHHARRDLRTYLAEEEA